jgi:putative phosphoribosyl transferase
MMFEHAGLHPLFHDRRQAGRELARHLARYAGEGNVVVLGLPRGGIPVAYEVAMALDAPLDAYVVRKLGAPGHAELAIGAIAAGGVRVLRSDVIDQLGVDDATLAKIEARERAELERREAEYRRGAPPVSVEGRIVIVVDDGLATGSTMIAAVSALRASNPARIVVGVPVAAPEACDDVSRYADEMACARRPVDFLAVGLWYQEFPQTTDEEVHELLARAKAREAPALH